MLIHTAIPMETLTVLQVIWVVVRAVTFVKLLSVPIAAVNVWAETLSVVADMKTKNITFCGIAAALATVIMLTGYFPYLTYAIPCIASMVIMVVVVELGKKYAFATYLVSLLPIILFCEPESKLLYICLAGFYPILKAIFEKTRSRVLEYILKIALVNASIFAIYLLSVFVLGIPFDDMGEFGKYGGAILVIAANITFLLYDFCIGKMAFAYIIKFHPSVKKMLK